MNAVIALFIGAASAVSLNDAPPYFNEPTWNQGMPSASGFVQTSSCLSAGVEGVSCVPNAELFATGMNGDEDLGEDIQMKGKPFHYAQAGWTPVEVATAPGALPPCTGTNGPDGVNCQRPACDGANGPVDHGVGAPCTRDEPAAIPHYNTDPTAGRPYATTGDITPTYPGGDLVQLRKDDDLSAPEKVHVLDPKIAKQHTTFYGQQ